MIKNIKRTKNIKKIIPTLIYKTKWNDKLNELFYIAHQVAQNCITNKDGKNLWT